MKAPLPQNEQARLQALHCLQILDTPPERDFDDLAALASEICEAPISLISLVDEDRQWFKARIGLDVPQTSRDVSFCAHAILGDDLFIVPDAQADSRFADNPLVTAQPDIRFYAGAPLITEAGDALGSLCVLDHKPRTLSERQLQSLRRLRRQAVRLLELRRAGLTLGQMEEEARRVAAFRERFIGILGHDLRNPLSVLRLGASGLLGLRDVPAPAREIAGVMHAGTERMGRMIDDLLDLTRVRLGGGMPVKPRPADLHALCRQTVEQFRLSHPARFLQLSCEGAGEGAWDPDRVMQAIGNLVGNAFQYSPAGAAVHLSCSGGTDTVTLAVNNQGPPIPESLLPDLFDPFRRGPGAEQTHRQGLGLGLYIVKAIVDAHHGTISVSSHEGEGTTFTITWPRGPAPPSG